MISISLKLKMYINLFNFKAVLILCVSLRFMINIDISHGVAGQPKLDNIFLKEILSTRVEMFITSSDRI